VQFHDVSSDNVEVESLGEGGITLHEDDLLILTRR
jgi:hypothetical protein